MRVPFMRDVLARIAPTIGATVMFHPDGYVGAISFSNGAYSLFWDNKFNLNPVSSAKIAQDKAYTSFVLRSAGIAVPEEKLFFRSSSASYVGRERCGVARALSYAESLGFPVYLKPNRLSQGRLVFKVHDPAEFRAAAKEIFRAGRGMLVQRPIPGRDYRLIVLDDELLSAYERLPLTLVGDGVSSIHSQLKRLQERFELEGRDTVLDLADPRIGVGIGRLRSGWETVLASGERYQLVDAANLSLGGTTLDVFGAVHESIVDLARNTARVLDLRLCGVDILVDNASSPGTQAVVLEANSAPGLDGYVFAGPENDSYVDSLYLKVLRAVEQGPNRRDPVRG